MGSEQVVQPSSEQEASRTMPCYYLVWVVKFSSPVVEKLDDVPSLVARLRALTQSEDAALTWISVFHGDRLFLSKGTPRHLLVPGQPAIPLADASVEPDYSGYLVDFYAGLLDSSPPAIAPANDLDYPAEQDDF